MKKESVSHFKPSGRRLTTTLFLPGILAVSLCTNAWASIDLGIRVPTAYVVSIGAGQSNEGLPPDPYETFSYDIALQQAGIENFNVMYYTSVLPKEAVEIPMQQAKKYFHHGAVLEAIMAKSGGVQGDTVVAGIGRVWAVDPKTGKKIGGFAAEYEFKYEHTKVSQAQAQADAKAQLTKSLKHELSIRNLKQSGAMKYDISSLYITDKYGMALASLGFISFKYLDPIPGTDRN